MAKFPLWPIFLLAAAQLWAFVHYTVEDSPWRLVGAGIAFVLSAFAAFGYLLIKK